MSELLHQPEDMIAQRYRILDTLGEGGSGTTYLAEDLPSGEQVALKALSLRHMSDWKVIALFEREAQVLAQLNHPAIPHYLEYFHVDTAADRSFYIAQQLAQGQSLFSLVENGWHPPQEQVRHIAIQILEILDYLHQLQPSVIHRDIKPQNIIRRDDGRVFLVDFGSVQNTYHSTFARSSTVVGTFGYMAPEQFIGQAVPATDLYGLGATLLFLLTHRSPADLPTDNLKIDFRCSRLQISSEFADWLEKILEPDVEDRFPSAREALAQLRSVRSLPAKSSSSKRWKGFVKLGLAAVAGISVLIFFKYPILNYLGLIPPEVYKAAESENLDAVRHYLEEGIDVNARDGAGKTPLHWAKSKEMAEFLIAKGAIVNARDNFGFTPLHLAVGKDNKDLAELLIAKGANVKAKLRFYLPPPSHPLDIGYRMRMNSLVFGNSSSLLSGSGVTPLHLARSLQMAQLLIAKGADVNAKTKSRATPLHMAASKGLKEIVELMISRGADVNAETKFGTTLLHRAAQKGSKDVVELLIAHGANVVARDATGKTPLHLATTKEAAAPLIIDVNARDNQGKTPLHDAVAQYHSKKDVIELLLARGANVNAKDKEGNTPLQAAVASYKYTNGKKDIVLLLLANGADVNAKNNQGNSLLHEAAWNNKDLVELLIGNGANVNAKDNKGNTPLHRAGLQSVALLLVAKGADVTVRDDQGNTLLHKAARNDWKSLVELLLAMNADVNAKNNEGKTPLGEAGTGDVAELLKRHGAIK